MLNFGASKPRVRGGARPPGPPLDPHLISATLEIVIHNSFYITAVDEDFKGIINM